MGSPVQRCEHGVPHLEKTPGSRCPLCLGGTPSDHLVPKAMASAKKEPEKPKHGWEGPDGKGEPPFKGAGPPIHLRDGGKFHPKNRKPKEK